MVCEFTDLTARRDVPEGDQALHASGHKRFTVRGEQERGDRRCMPLNRTLQRPLREIPHRDGTVDRTRHQELSVVGEAQHLRPQRPHEQAGSANDRNTLNTHA